MKIEHQSNDKNGKFFILKDGEEIGEMTYVIDSEGDMVINHTFVEEEFRDEGYANDMVDFAVDFARSKSIRIMPQCPYVRGLFRGSSEYKDIYKKFYGQF